MDHLPDRLGAEKDDRGRLHRRAMTGGHGAIGVAMPAGRIVGRIGRGMGRMRAGMKRAGQGRRIMDRGRGGVGRRSARAPEREQGQADRQEAKRDAHAAIIGDPGAAGKGRSRDRPPRGVAGETVRARSAARPARAFDGRLA